MNVTMYTGEEQGAAHLFTSEGYWVQILAWTVATHQVCSTFVSYTRGPGLKLQSEQWLP